MTWQLCNGSSEYLLDMWGGCPEDMSWQAAKKHFRDLGYEGKYLLIRRSEHGFKLWKINIKPKGENEK